MADTQPQPGATQRSATGADAAPDGEILLEVPQGQEDLRSLMEKLRRIECAAAADSQRRRLSHELLEKLRRHTEDSQEPPSRRAAPRPDVWLIGAGILLATPLPPPAEVLPFRLS